MNLPEIGKTYNCFDDGKITFGRMYQVTITDIIPINEADENLLELWGDRLERESIREHKLFDPEIKQFVKGISNETDNENNNQCFFAKTTYGGWFGLGIWWNCGRLDVDGSLTQRLTQ